MTTTTAESSPPCRHVTVAATPGLAGGGWTCIDCQLPFAPFAQDIAQLRVDQERSSLCRCAGTRHCDTCGGCIAATSPMVQTTIRDESTSTTDCACGHALRDHFKHCQVRGCMCEGYQRGVREKDALGPIPIRVNGALMIVNTPTVSYETVVLLAGKRTDRLWTIVCSKPAYGKNRVLAPGETVFVKDGTQFDIADTSRA